MPPYFHREGIVRYSQIAAIPGFIIRLDLFHKCTRERFRMYSYGLLQRLVVKDTHKPFPNFYTHGHSFKEILLFHPKRR